MKVSSSVIGEAKLSSSSRSSQRMSSGASGVGTREAGSSTAAANCKESGVEERDWLGAREILPRKRRHEGAGDEARSDMKEGERDETEREGEADRTKLMGAGGAARGETNLEVGSIVRKSARSIEEVEARRVREVN